MKRFTVLVVALLCIVNFIAGCGVAHSLDQRKRRIKNINEFYARQQVDDWDQIFLYDRISYLTEWPLRDTDD